MASQADLPRKTRELMNHHLDSRVWNAFPFRPNDVIVATYPKSGTTWMQQIVLQILSKGKLEIPLHTISPWLDSRIGMERHLAMLSGQKHRRFIKSHLPLNALQYRPRPKYIYVARDGRDACFSLYNHLANATDFYFNMYNNMPGRIGPPLMRPGPEVRDFFRQWLADSDRPDSSYWEHIRSWWDGRNVPNIMLVHYADLKRDLDGQLRRIASFLGNVVPDEAWPVIADHCSFDYMKSHANLFIEAPELIFKGGAQAVINKGFNGRWRDVLTSEDIAAYEQTARAQLSEECVAWLANGAGASKA